MRRRTLLQLGAWAAAAPAAPVWAAAPGLGPVGRLQVEDLLARSVWFLDTGDAAALAQVLTADGVVVDRRGKSWSPAGFAAQYAGPSARRGRQHEAQINKVSEAPDGSVSVRSYWASVVWAPGAAAPVVDGLGTWDDVCVRAGEGFLIKERRIGTWDSSTVSVPRI